jgi:hypothetical protein
MIGAFYGPLNAHMCGVFVKEPSDRAVTGGWHRVGGRLTWSEVCVVEFGLDQNSR